MPLIISQGEESDRAFPSNPPTLIELDRGLFQTLKGTKKTTTTHSLP